MCGIILFRFRPREYGVDLKFDWDAKFSVLIRNTYGLSVVLCVFTSATDLCSRFLASTPSYPCGSHLHSKSLRIRGECRSGKWHISPLSNSLGPLSKRIRGIQFLVRASRLNPPRPRMTGCQCTSHANRSW